MKRIALLVVVACFGLLAACGVEGISDVTPTAQPEPTEPFTPIVIQATSTPVAAPATRTPRPSATSEPTKPPAPTTAGETPQATATTPPAGVDTTMLAIAAGSFEMGSNAGSPDAKPAHKVDVAAFQIDEFEVTNADFRKFVEATGYETEPEKTGDKSWDKFAEGKDNHPVVKVSWNDATAFCEWAGKRLPTEAEWEFAARGTDAFAFPYGNTFDAKNQNGKESGIRGTTDVGSYPAGASPFQVFDLAGNVWEWTSSKPEKYPGNTTNSKFYGEGLYVLRGGGWFDVADQLASTFRNSAVPTTANDDLGFRCAK
jgi:formylglycine-generating enzyme required for sulfatase activity